MSKDDKDFIEQTMIDIETIAEHHAIYSSSQEQVNLTITNEDIKEGTGRSRLSVAVKNDLVQKLIKKGCTAEVTECGIDVTAAKIFKTDFENLSDLKRTTRIIAMKNIVDQYKLENE